MELEVKSTVLVKLTIVEARKIRQDLLDIDPSRINVETMTFREDLTNLLDRCEQS